MEKRASREVLEAYVIVYIYSEYGMCVLRCNSVNYVYWSLKVVRSESLRCQPVDRLEESKGRIVGALKEYGAAPQICSEDTLCFKDTVKRAQCLGRKEKH